MKKINFLLFAILFICLFGSCAKNKTEDKTNQVYVDSVATSLSDTSYNNDTNEVPAMAMPEDYGGFNEIRLIRINFDSLSNSKKVTYPLGKISYSIPDTMYYDKEYRAVLRIAKEELDSVMNSNSGTKTSKGFVLVKNIRVSSVMSAELTSVSTKDDFTIKELSSKEQDIDEVGYTEWQWNIRPKKSGSHSLILVVKVKEFNGEKSTIKDVPVFEKEIMVHARPLKSIWNFVMEYWQWIIAVLLIPIIKYLWGLRRK